MTHYIEIVWIISTILLIISMAYNYKDKKHTLIMRIINAISALLFIVYSIFFSAYSTILSNLNIFFIDIYYVIKLLYSKKWSINI